MFNNVGAHWPSHLQLVPCPNTLTSALFCLNVTPLESCPDTLATQGGPSLPFASFCVICVFASWFVIDPSFTVRSQPNCDHQSQELKEVATWTVLATQKGSEIQGHCLLLAPRQTQTDEGSRWCLWNAMEFTWNSSAHRNAMCVHFFWHAENSSRRGAPAPLTHLTLRVTQEGIGTRV